MKGLNASGVASAIAEAWSSFADPVCIPADASRFDQHVSVDALRFEHGVYNGVFRDPELAYLLRLQLRNYGRCYTDTHRVAYEVDGCRMSGDMNTGCGNCLIVSLLVYQFCLDCGLGIGGTRSGSGRYGIPKVAARLIDNGDDFSLIVERRFQNVVMARLGPWFLDYGFTLKVEEPVDSLEKIEFCQAHPVWCADGWRMVRNLDALSKDTLCLRVGHEAEMWMAAVGECGHALAGCVPIYCKYYEVYRAVQARPLRRFVAFDDMGMFRMSRGMCGDYPVTDDCRASFYEAFGITPDEQRAIERQYELTRERRGRGDAFDRRTRGYRCLI